MRPLCALLLTFALTHCAASPTALHATPAPTANPPVVVTMVVDQLGGWVADARLTELPPDGGFARLRREGTWLRHVRFAHAATDTAPGHAALFTGLAPRDTAIFGNEVPDGHGGRASILRDEATHTVTPDGTLDEAGSSIARLAVPTLADRVRATHPATAIVSLSIKDRGAIFGGGRTPDAVLWFDPAYSTFVTSSAFATSFPAWARDAGGPDAIAALRATPWTPLDADWVRAHAATADDAPGEGDLGGFGTVFPHLFERARQPGKAFRASPRGDDAVLALALAAVDHARAADAPILLALSLSSNDYVGHLFGPDSWEAWDELRRLDASLAHFFHALDARVGPTGWALVLSADHGILPLPESASSPAARAWCNGAARDPFQRPCTPYVRIDPDALQTDLDAVAQRAIGQGHWVLGVADPYVFLTRDALALPSARRDALVSALTASLRMRPGIDAVIDTRTTPPHCPDAADDSVPALVCRAIPPHAPGTLYLLAKPGAFFDAGYAPGFGTSHGSPYLYDRTVPVLVRAPGRVLAGVARESPVSFTVFAETAAALLGVPWPRRSGVDLVQTR